MTQNAELLNKINRLPARYFNEAIDFIGYLQYKAQQEANNTEPKQEIRESSIQYSTDNNGKILLTKELINEMLQKSPNTHALSGILSGTGDVDLDKVRMERLARHI